MERSGCTNDVLGNLLAVSLERAVHVFRLGSRGQGEQGLVKAAGSASASSRPTDRE